MTSVEDVDDAAKAPRERWHVGDDAILNLCEFLEERGIKICAINANDPGERQRFTVAHELGHLYLEIPKQRDPDQPTLFGCVQGVWH